MAGALRVGALVLVSALIWAAHYERWTPEQWRVPTDYVGDAHEILARIKAASEGDTLPPTPEIIARLGAPFGANWNEYPTPDKPLMMALGGLTHLIGLFAAANAGLLFAQITAALAFYFTMRWLRCRWEWAFAGALLFAYTYHTFHRGLPHFSFVFTWTVPLGLLAVWLVAQSRRLEWRSRGAMVCFGVALAMGVSNPYNLMFWGQLLLWALVAQWCGARRRVNLAIGLTAGVVAVMAFLVTNAEIWIYEESEGMPLLARNYGGTERYALKPLEMFIPPQYHRIEELSFLGERYKRWSEWRGEDYMPYLGVVGIVGLVWLVAASARRFFQRRAVPGQVLSAGWLLAYSTVGGLTNVLAFFVGFQVFRATNRVTVFLSALLLVFLMTRLSRATAAWPARWRLAAALGVATLGLLDQIPRRWPEEVRARMAADVKSDVQLGRLLEATLPAGSMIFQIPVLGFPEVLPPFRLVDYEHFRPYLTTQTMCFSYGAPKFRARSRWQRDLENVPVETLVRRLESYGFAALYLNRKGYEDRAEKLLGVLDALGYTRRLAGELGQQVVVLLNPSPQPEKPMGRNLTFGQGWHTRPENGVRWANDDAVMSFYNPYDRPIGCALRLELIGVSPREVVVQHQGRQVATAHLSAEPAEIALPDLKLEPGVNVFKILSSAAAERVGTGRRQLRTFGLKSSSIEPLAAAVAAR
ncbi:MAG: hypothetical protein ABIQ12_11455 [Opitutaceae bacterium]